MKKTTRLLLFVLGILTATAQAEVYLVKGDIFDNVPAKRGEFEFLIDEADLTVTLTSDNPALSAPLAIEPWYGYDVLDVTATVDGVSFGLADLLPVEPAVSGPEAEFYIEGAPLGSYSGQDFMALFSNGATGDLLLIGFATVSIPEAEVIINQTIWEIDGNGDQGSEPQGGGFQNVTVTVAPKPIVIDDFTVGGTGLPISDTVAEETPVENLETGLDTNAVFTGRRLTRVDLTSGNPGGEFETGEITASLDTAGGCMNFMVAEGSTGFPELVYDFPATTDLTDGGNFRHLLVEAEGFTEIRVVFTRNSPLAFGAISRPVVDGVAQIPFDNAAVTPLLGLPDVTQIDQLTVAPPFNPSLPPGSYKFGKIMMGEVSGPPRLHLLGISPPDVHMAVTNLPIGETFHFRESGTLSGFSVMTPAQDVDWTSAQPLMLPTGGGTRNFYSLFAGVSP